MKRLKSPISARERTVFATEQMIACKPVAQEAARRFDPFMAHGYARTKALTEYKPLMGMLGIISQASCAADPARMARFNEMAGAYPEHVGALYGTALAIGYALALADRMDELKRNGQ